MSATTPTTPYDPAAVASLRQLVRAGLAREDRPGADVAWHWDADLDHGAFLAAARRHFLAPFVVDHGDHLGVPAPVLDALRPDRERLALTVLLWVHQTRVVLEALEAAGVRALVFKGPVLARLTTGDPTARGVGDVDVWVDPADVATAHRALDGAGFRPDPTYPRPGDSFAWRHTVRTYYEVAFTGDHVDVDLHWWLDPRRRLGGRFEDAWRTRRTVELAGVRVPTLAADLTFTHTCLHAAKDEWSTLRALVDVHRLARSPETWAGLALPLRDTRALTLAVADAEVGLPPAVRDRYAVPDDRRAAGVARSETAQLHRVVREDHTEAPWGGQVRAARRFLTGQQHPADVARTLAQLAVPTGKLGGLEHLSAPRAVAVVVLRRLRRLAVRVAALRRRR